MLKAAVEIALEKGEFLPKDIDIVFCGDLLNQCVASSFAISSFGIPYAGLYGACSTMALGLIMSANAVESGAANKTVCAASSHFCTAERQYRTPLEYGSQRPPTSQWTVTGAGACVIGKAHNESQIQTPAISSAQIGRIVDYNITDQNNMGAAMAPAAADTIYRFLESTKTNADDYDAIFTGDLGRIGSRLLLDLMLEKEIDISAKHKDCGVMIYDGSQDVHAGGSGCGCCASVLCSHILKGMCNQRYRNILFVATGALLSPTTVQQKRSIPSIAHLVNMRI